MKISLLLLSSLFLPSQAEVSDISRPIHIVTESLPPYQVLNQGKIEGFSTEIVKEVFKRAELPYIMSINSWTRSYNLALQRKGVCIYSIARLPFRESLFRWIGNITKTNMVIFGAKGKAPFEIQSLKQALNHTVAVIKDDITHQALLKHGFKDGENLYVVENTSSLLKLLISREDIDLIVADDITIHYRALLANIDMSQISRLFEMPDLPLNFYLACNKDTDAASILRLEQALIEIKQDGSYQKIFEKWQRYLPNAKPSD